MRSQLSRGIKSLQSSTLKTSFLEGKKVGQVSALQALFCNMAASTDAAAISAELTAAALERICFEKDVPSDITISQSVEPFHISKIATAAGIADDELEPYGSHKAKVRADFAVRLWTGLLCTAIRASSHLII